MAAFTTLNTYEVVELQDSEENKSFTSSSIKSDLINFCSVVKETPESAKGYEEILNITTYSIKTFANSNSKSTTYLEPNEIDRIKISLKNYVNDHEKIDAFKNEVIKDLTEFQNQIKANHIQRITDLTKEKQFCERQIKILECGKHKLIMERLSKVVWPYDEKTKEYDNKIAKLQLQVQQYTNKIENLKNMRPAANEKDILLYKLHLVEKFAKK